ncbi:MAG: HlyD family type I secretion periplasmic adaptor subunit [Caulobacterales bacterium]
MAKLGKKRSETEDGAPPEDGKAKKAFLRVIQGGPREPVDMSDDSAFKEMRAGRRILFWFFGVLGLFAALAPLDSGVVAPGVIKVSGNRQTVQHRDGGTVAVLNATEGQKVKAGDVLLELAATELSAQDQSLTSQAIELEATRARLRAEVSGAPNITRPPEWQDLPAAYADAADAVLARQNDEMLRRREAHASQEAVTQERAQQLRARIDGYKRRVASSVEQMRLMDEELEGLRTLGKKGLVPLNRIREKERERADLEGSLGLAEASIQEAKEAIGETQMQIIAMRQARDKEIAEMLRQTETQLADVSPRVAAVRVQLAGTRVRAPVDGTVVGLRIFTVGGVIRPGDPIMDIVPNEHPLVIEARVRPEDADDVHHGMKTEIRFSALKGRNLPVIHGYVERISADRFDDQRTGQGYFIAEVTVPKAELDRVAKARGEKTLNLTAGLPAETIIPLQKRTALQFLLDPLNQALWNSFRQQ